MTHNEAFFLRPWCNYYCAAFQPDNVYLLDHGSTDDSIAAACARHPGVHVEAVENAKVHDHGWMRDTIKAKQTELLQDYEVVVYAETDEFLVAAGPEGLVGLLESFRTDPGRMSIRATAWHPIHQFLLGEPDLKPVEGQSLLEDRASMWRLPGYDKTPVTKVPLEYGLGFHQVVGSDAEASPALVLLHAWMIDLTMFREKRMLTLSDAQQALLTRRFARFASSGDRHPIPDAWKAALVW